MPLAEPTDKLPEKADQVPPVVGLESKVVDPTHTLAVPVTGSGSGLTVEITVVLQPVGNVYVTVVVPGAKPDTKPVVETMLVTAASPEAQVPPAVLLVSMPVPPAHNCNGPVIDGGFGLTVTAEVRKQPVGSWYVIVAVPDAMPVTKPVIGPTVAIAVLLLLQLPLAVADVSVICDPAHIFAGPVITEGKGLMVAVAADMQPLPKW
jgi:hypothetical protein